MKLEFLLSRLATFSVFASAVGLALNSVALACFAGAVGSFILLIAAGDYARRPGYAMSRSGIRTEAVLGQAVLPLAA